MDICANKHGGNQESTEAHLSTPAEARRVMRETILRYAMRRGADGLTIDEVSRVVGLAPNCVSGRVSELKRDGLLVETQLRRKTRLGRSARVLVVKGAA